MRAELANGDLERRSRAQRRLLEEQRDVHPGERGRRWRVHAKVSGRLQLGRQRQQTVEIGWTEVDDGKEVLRQAGWRRGSVHGRHVRYSPLMRTYSALRSH